MKKILIVVDCQNDFITGTLAIAGASEVVPKIVEKIGYYKDGLVVLTRDTHTEDYLKTHEGNRLPVEHCVGGSKGWMVQSEIFDAAEESAYTMCDKTGFGCVDMVKELINLVKGEEDNKVCFELVGFATDICVISNAMLLRSYFPESDIVVDASCCAGVTKESHLNALNAMKMCHIDIISEEK